MTHDKSDTADSAQRLQDKLASRPRSKTPGKICDEHDQLPMGDREGVNKELGA